MIGVCKFCGCTENSPCIITLPRESQVAGGETLLISAPCAWLLEDVCTNPDCVLKAYIEARPKAESLMAALELLEVA